VLTIGTISDTSKNFTKVKLRNVINILIWAKEAMTCYSVLMHDAVTLRTAYNGTSGK